MKEMKMRTIKRQDEEDELSKQEIGTWMMMCEILR